MPISANLYWSLDGQNMPGWLDVEIFRSVEACPMTLQASVTEHFPGSTPITIKCGQKIVVEDDDGVVFTGWLDTVDRSVSPSTHTIQITARSLVCDIVDSTNLYSYRIDATSVIDYAKKLCGPFNITVVDDTAGAKLPPIPAANLSLTDRVFDLIERTARYSGVLLYDDEQGRLVLGAVGKDRMADTLAEGKNILSGGFRQSWAQRYTEYKFVWSASNPNFGEIGNANQSGLATDPELKASGRVRPFVGVSTQNDVAGRSIAQQRAVWECNRRMGRGNALRVDITGWRDSAGNLWRPNALVTAAIPSLGVQSRQFVIAEVSHRRSVDSGTTCELTLYPSEAFSVEPVATLSPVVTLIASPDQPGALPTGSTDVPATGTASPSNGRRDRG